jgi:hypothetical protein
MNAIEMLLKDRMPTVDLWLATRHHRTHKGNALDLSTHSWQRGMLADPSRDKRAMKAVQCGVSEAMLVSAMACIDRGERVFWVFPTEAIRNRFVAERFDPVLQATPRYLASAMAARGRVRSGHLEADATSLKQLGDAAIAFIGSNSPASFAEFVADWVFVDELDRCDQAMLTLARDRIGHSSVRGFYRVSNPSMIGCGIEALYSASDRKRWMIPCAHCGERQALEWAVNFVRQTDDGRYDLLSAKDGAVCRKCGWEFDRFSVGGEWIAEQAGDGSSGYHVSQLFSGSATVAELYADWERAQGNHSELQRFYNSVLGEGFKAEGAKLYPELLLRIIGQHGQSNIGERCIMGIDVGADIHVVIGDQQGRILRLACLHGTNAFNELQNMVQAYRATAVIDADYDPRTVRQFAERNQGKVYLCSYRTTETITDVDYRPSERLLLANRTQTMDDSHAAIIAGEVSLPRDAMTVPDFVDQMCAPTRIEEKIDSRHGGTRSVFRWVEGSQADHYRHAFNYYRIGQRFFSRHGQIIVAAIGRGVTVG